MFAVAIINCVMIRFYHKKKEEAKLRFVLLSGKWKTCFSPLFSVGMYFICKISGFKY